MDKSHSNIFVAGDYIASQTIGTQIIGGSHSHHYSSPDTRETPYATRMAEDVEFEDVTVVSDETEKTPDGKRQPFPFVVAEKLAELNLYTMSEFEQKYREAAANGAPVLAAFLKQYQKLCVLNFGRLNKKQIFYQLRDFFKDEIGYDYNNFITYF